MFKTLLLRTLLAGAALSVVAMPAAPSYAAEDGEESTAKKKSKRGKKKRKKSKKKKKEKKLDKESAKAAAVASAKENARANAAAATAEREKAEAEEAARKEAAEKAAAAEAKMHAQHLGVIERLEQIASATKDDALSTLTKSLREKEAQRHELASGGGAE